MTFGPVFTLADLGLFQGGPQHQNFCRLKDLGPTRTLTPSTKPYEFPQGDQAAVPETYDMMGQTKNSEDFFTDTDTAALLVLHDGKVVYERYALTGGADVPWLSMSVAKSFASTLVGIALEEGHIKSLDDPISDYVSVDKGSAYDGVAIRTVLRMSSGARWNEDYSDPNSDIVTFAQSAAGIDDGNLDKFIASMVREVPPETICRYNSAETQVLGALVKGATGRSVTDYMQEKLYEPLGMRYPGYWLVDSKGVEHAYAGLNLTAQDYAKIGELFRNGGKWDGKQIISSEWVHDATNYDSPMRAPGSPVIGSHTVPFGYGYQWWVPDGTEGEFTGVGVYNQFVYVNAKRKVTIVKLSANHNYGLSEGEEHNREYESLCYMRAIAGKF